MSTEKLAFMMGAGKYSKPIEDACIRWGIVEGRDKVRFIAQCSVETAGFKCVSELTNYSAAGLLRVFKGRNGLMTLAQAQLLVSAGPRAVFNHVYGGKWGRENLGNIEPDDGWNFRGRGLIQTTGRDNYRATSMGMYGDLRLLEDPDLLMIPEEAASSAGYYWYSRRLNGIEDVRAVTKKINAGLLHLPERIKKTNDGYEVLDFLTSHTRR